MHIVNSNIDHDDHYALTSVIGGYASGSHYARSDGMVGFMERTSPKEICTAKTRCSNEAD